MTASSNGHQYEPASARSLVELRSPPWPFFLKLRNEAKPVPNMAEEQSKEESRRRVGRSTGMRRLELASLKLWDLDLERATARIRLGKGKKDRFIPLGDRAPAWLAKYIVEARPKLVSEPDDKTVFLSNAGEPFSLDHLSDLVRVYVDASGTR